MKCQHCGAEIADNAAFCVQCGAKVAQDHPQSAQPQDYYQTASNPTPNYQDPANSYQPQGGQPYPNSPYQPTNPYGQPPQKKGKTGLIIGIIVAVVLVVLGVVAIALIVGGSSNAPEEAVVSTTEETSVVEETEEPTVSKEEEPEKTSNGSFTITETTLFDASGVKAVATGVSEDDYYGPVIDVTVTNDSDKSVYVSSEYVVVNGYTLNDAYFSETIAAGKSANGSLHFDQEELKLCGIDTIMEIRVVLSVMDDESYDMIAEGELVTMETSLKGTTEQKYDDSGVEVCNQDGIRVVGKELYEEEYYDGSLLLYVENNTDQFLTVTTAYDSVSINGVMADEAFYADMAPNSRAIVKMYFMDLEGIGLSSPADIEEMELVVEAYDGTTYEDVMETDPITLTFE